MKLFSLQVFYKDEISSQDFIIFTAKLLVERANKGTRTTVAEQEYRLHTYAVIKSDRECHYDQLPVQLTKWQNPSTSDAMTRVQEEVEETKLVMHSTIQALLDRGEKLDDLVSKSETLSEQSKMFYTSARKMNKCCSYV
ncbi:unnamed protein product, partial [Mesorhabditis spiculigera]